MKNVTTFGKLLLLLLFPSSFFLLTCIKTTTRNELARLGMGTIFLVYIYIRDSQLNRPESVSLASLARQLWYVQNFVLITRKEGGA